MEKRDLVVIMYTFSLRKLILDNCMRTKMCENYTSAYLEAYSFIHPVIKFFHMHFWDLEMEEKEKRGRLEKA